MNNNKVFYEDFHKIRAKSTSISGVGRWEYALIKDIIKYLNKNDIKNILEIGCGRGNKTVILADYFKNSKITGIDFSSSGIEVANDNYKNYSNLEFVNAELNDFISNKSKIKQFDMTVTFEVLEHIEDWKSLLNDIIRATNKYVLISAPTGRMREFEKNIGHFRNFKKGEIEEFMINNGFKIVKTFYAGFPFYSPLARDYANRNYNKIMENVGNEFTIFQRVFHSLVYILLRYCSLKNYGDAFYGLFEKVN